MYLIDDIDLYTGEAFISRGLMVTDGALIAYAGADTPAARARFSGAKHIDGNGGTMIPGLVNAHTHAAMSILRGFGSDLNLMGWLDATGQWEARFTPDIVYWGTLLAAAEMIRSGVTAFADMYFHMDSVAQAVLDCGIRANLCRGSSDIGGVDSHIPLHARFDKAGDGRVSIWMGVHAEYTSTPDVVRRAVDTAREMGAGVHVHISESAYEVNACRERHGVSPVRYFHDLGLFSQKTLAAHCVHVSAEDQKLLANPNIYIAHCPSSNLKLANGISPVSDMLGMGINMAIGTDGAASNNTLDMLRETRFASLLAKGASGDPTALDAARALRMSTRDGALALGFADCGLLKPGMRADLAIVSARDFNLWPNNDPIAGIVYGACGQNVTFTMANGVPLYENGRLTTIDIEAVKRRVRAFLDA